MAKHKAQMSVVHWRGRDTFYMSAIVISDNSLEERIRAFGLRERSEAVREFI